VIGAHPLGFLDAVYTATMSYTTVGFGDVVPVGAIRFLAGTCALSSAGRRLVRQLLSGGAL
jgi:hypothetical protein